MPARSIALLLCVAMLSPACRLDKPRVHAGLSAQEILARAAASYRSAHLYEDAAIVERSGSLYLKIVSALGSGRWEDGFRTRLTRGGEDYFEYTRRDGKTLTAKGNATTGTARTPYAPEERFDSWRSAVRAIGALTSRSASPAMELFDAEEGAESILALRDLERLPDDEMRGERCAVIRGRTPRQRFTLWIDSAFRLRRIQHYLGDADEPVADVRYLEVVLR